MVRSALLRRLGYAPLRVVPTSRRQAAVVRSASLLEPLIRRSGKVPMPAFALGSYREFLTSALLQSVTHDGIEFDPVIDIRGGDEVPKGASVLVSGHFYLNFLFIRWVNDNVGEPAVFLAHDVEKWLLQGTRKPMQIIAPGRHSLLKVREALNANSPVIGAIDALEARGKSWADAGLAERQVYASGSLLKFARRASIPLFFFDTYIERSGRIAGVVDPIMSADPMRDYARFLANALERRRGMSGVAGSVLGAARAVDAR